MKKECAVVQDLLVLYEDDVLHEESRQMVEEHIRSCEDCMKVYDVSKEVPLPELEQKGAVNQQMQEGAQKVMSRLEKWATVRVLIVAGVIFLALTVMNAFCNHITGEAEGGWKRLIYGVSSDEIEVTELYQLAGGDIYCAVKSDALIGRMQTVGLQNPEYRKNRSEEQELEISLLERTHQEEEETPEFNQMIGIFPVELECESEESGKIYHCQAKQLVFYGKTRSDKKVIWKQGQEIPSAPEEIEYQAIASYFQNGETEKALAECAKMGWDSYELLTKSTKEKDQGDGISNGDGVPILLDHFDVELYR